MGHASRNNSGERPRELTQRRFNHGAALTLDAQAKAIQQTREYMADLSVRLDAVQATNATQQGQLAQLAADHLKFKFRSFGERVRWFFLGK